MLSIQLKYKYYKLCASLESRLITRPAYVVIIFNFIIGDIGKGAPLVYTSLEIQNAAIHTSVALLEFGVHICCVSLFISVCNLYLYENKFGVDFGLETGFQ